MTRAILILTCASLALLSGPSEARQSQAGTSAKPAAVKPAAAKAAKVALARATLPKVKAQPARPLTARTATAPKATPVKVSRPEPARVAPRVRVKDVVAKLPGNERKQVSALLQSKAVAASLPVRRAVAAFVVLRGMKGGSQLPISAADMKQMSESKRWTSKRMANLALVLRTAVGIAAAEGISAGAAFQKALKKYGIEKKYNRGVCGA